MVDRSEAMTEAAAPTVSPSGSYVDWAAIAAGAVVATAIAFVFSSFGTALGLGVVSPEPGEGWGATFAIIATGLWALWTTVSSFMAGGYLAGRMRRRIDTASADEISIRDGGHGLAVWGVGVIIGALLLSSAIGTTARVAGNVAETAVSAAGSAVAGAGRAVAGAGSAVSELVPEQLQANPLSSAANPLFREEGRTPNTQTERLRNEAMSVLATVLQDGELDEQDRDYLVRLVSENTQLDQAEVEARVDQAIQAVQQARNEAIQAAEQAKQEAQEAADIARQYAVVSAFILAAALLVAGAGAYWAAGVGGRHRDENRVFARFGVWH